MKQLLAFTFLTVALYANSGGPGQGYANNAPNFNNCTSCHNGTQNSVDGSVFFTGLPNRYVPGETYTIGVTVTGATSGIEAEVVNSSEASSTQAATIYVIYKKQKSTMYYQGR